MGVGFGFDLLSLSSMGFGLGMVLSLSSMGFGMSSMGFGFVGFKLSRSFMGFMMGLSFGFKFSRSSTVFVGFRLSMVLKRSSLRATMMLLLSGCHVMSSLELEYTFLFKYLKDWFIVIFMSSIFHHLKW